MSQDKELKPWEDWDRVMEQSYMWAASNSYNAAHFYLEFARELRLREATDQLRYNEVRDLLLRDAVAQKGEPGREGPQGPPGAPG